VPISFRIGKAADVLPTRPPLTSDHTPVSLGTG
jgi:hypothetical protein